MNKKQKGFSLIELLIVVAIILIIAAIAIPNLLRSRMAAAQASAVGSVRTINTASISYNSTYGDGFPPSLTAIVSNGTSAVTSASSSCSAGYGYADGYMVTATPVTVGTTGQTSYCSDPSGVIRFNAAGATNGGPSPNCATTDSPLQ